MLGLFDRAYTFCRSGKRRCKVTDEPEIKLKDSDEVSFYFVPRVVSQTRFGRGIIGDSESRVVYTLNSRDLIDESPNKTVENLKSIYHHAADFMMRFIDKGYRINLVGVSLGNVLSIKIGAEVANGNLNRLTSIVGGARLGISAWESILTKDKVQKGYSAQEYESAVSVFSPLNYTDKIKAKDLFFRIGTHDLLIPYTQGTLLRRALEVKANSLDVKTYLGADHCSAIYLSSIELRRKQN